MLKTKIHWFSIVTLVTLMFSSGLWADDIDVQAAPVEQVSFSEAELDQMLAPVALYPDTILSHILIASTYPLEVVQAERFAAQNSEMSTEELQEAASDKNWDPSVQALLAFPNILKRMSDDLDWTRRLGDAFLLSEEAVLASVQNLRRKAEEAGHLSSSDKIEVSHEEEAIVIEPASPEVVYVPYYDTRVVYGSWWWASYPPVYWAHSYHHNSYVYWGPRIYIGNRFYCSSFYWPGRHVVVINPGFYHGRYYGRQIAYHHSAYNWRHNPHHRHVAYNDNYTRDRYGVDHRPSRQEYQHQRRDSDPYQLRGTPTQGSTATVTSHSNGGKPSAYTSQRYAETVTSLGRQQGMRVVQPQSSHSPSVQGKPQPTVKYNKPQPTVKHGATPEVKHYQSPRPVQTNTYSPPPVKVQRAPQPTVKSYSPPPPAPTVKTYSPPPKTYSPPPSRSSSSSSSRSNRSSVRRQTTTREK